MTSSLAPKLQPPASRAEASDAARELDRMLSAAGLGAIWTTVSDDVGGRPLVQLPAISPVVAVELTRLIRRAMRSAYHTAENLHAVVRAHGLTDFPEPSVHDGRIRLGDVSVHTADRLARLLGAPPQPELDETPDWPEGNLVIDRLDAAFRKATKGGFMDVHFHPYCQRCDQDPAVTLGVLKVGTARHLVTALQFGA